MAKCPDCDRRSFLKGSGLTLAGFSLMSLLPGPLIRYAEAATSSKRFMFIFLRGGNDGLNTVIPHGDPDYNAETRPQLYISPTEAIDLNGFASLHPALGQLAEVYQAGQLAVLHRVGYANSSHSHFDGQRIWENGDPTRPQMFEGWLYRYIRDNAVADGARLPVFTAQNNPPLLLRGQTSFVNVANPNNFDYLHQPPRRDKLAAAWKRQYSDLSGLDPYRSVLSNAGVKLVNTLDNYQSWDQENWDPKDPDSGYSLFPVDAATNPELPDGSLMFAGRSYNFFRSLKICALAMLEGGRTRITGTQLGGFDSHDNQGTIAGDQAMLLSWLAYGLRSLRVALSGAALDDRGYPGIWDDVVVSTMSEFGRTSIENGSAGTDHANASCLFMAGGRVKGGVYNCDAATWPQGVMFGINGRYLEQRTDFRSVFWEVLRDHMGAEAEGVESVFPGYTAEGLAGQELGLISTA